MSLHLDDKRRQTHLQSISKPKVTSGEKNAKREKKSQSQNKKTRRKSAA
jgi:hypothetical protein